VSSVFCVAEVPKPTASDWGGRDVLKKLDYQIQRSLTDRGLNNGALLHHSASKGVSRLSGEDEGRLLNYQIHSLACLPRLALRLPLAYSFRDEGKNKAVQADSLSFGLGRKLRVKRFRESLHKLSGHS
jgi:hypothetical protein